MILTRLGYAVILVIIVVAAVAIIAVVRPTSGSGAKTLTSDEVVNYSKFGVVDSIDSKGNKLTVHFKKGFDTTSQFGDATTFESTLPSGSTVLTLLQNAGVPVNTDGGVRVNLQ